MSFSVFQLSRIGGRKKNEDRMGYSYTPGAAIFLVADGLGGHPQGDVAAQLCLQVVTAMFHKWAKPRLDDVPEFLNASLLAAHEQLMHYAFAQELNVTPCSTLVVTVVQDQVCYTAHCGDSRMYLVRDGAVLVRTVDHSVAEWKALTGQAQAGAEMGRHVLYSCLGAPKHPVIEIGSPVVLQPNDHVLLCSDGLWSEVSEEDIVRHLSDFSVTDASFRLAELALFQGGAHCDNVTLIAFTWDGADNPAPA